jgi:acyl dehydratase
MVKYADLKEGEIGPKMEYGAPYGLVEAEFKAYADAGGDTNPIHQDIVAAIKAGNSGMIAHGLYSHAMIGKMLVDWVGAKNVKTYGGRMLGMTRPGDIISFQGKITKKYTKDGENLVDMEVKSITKTTYLRGEASCDAKISDDEVLKNLAKGKIKVTIDWDLAGQKKFELVFDAPNLKVNPKRVIGDKALIRNWIRADKDTVTAEFIGKRKPDSFFFAIIVSRDSIVGTATVAVPE